MYFSTSKILFFYTLIIGMILSVSSVSWFSAWIGLELNLLSFIPIMIVVNDQYSSEAALKYFLIQALGSSLVMISASLLMIYSLLASTILFCALCLKLGAAPFHFWFSQVMNGLLWPQAMILMTIQKIAPLFLLCYLSTFNFIPGHLYLFAVLSAIMGSIGGLNQTSLRKLLAFSSINHMGWLLSSILISEKMMIVYLLFYCLVSLSVVSIFQYNQTFYFNHLMSASLPMSTKVVIFFSLLSLGGLPPFTGFLPKWMVIMELSKINSFILLFILLGASLVTLYFYLRIATMFFTLSKNKLMILFEPKSKYKWFISILIFINFFGLIVPFVTAIT